MSRLKTSSSKSAKTSSYDKTKRRKKKATPRRSGSSSAGGASSSSAPSPPPAAPSSPLHITAPSMRHSVSSSSGSPSAGTPTSSRECEQCGNPAQLELGANAKAVANCKKAAGASGCHVCDFVAFRKAQRHCVVCDKTQCDVFCDWCGHGFHAKCAKARGEPVDADGGFCCKKCEAEQNDPDSDSDDEANDVNAKCGECQLPFNSTSDATAAHATTKGKKDTKNAPDADATGFKVNQSVLVENDEVLYNAVITDVDAKNERIKIHFLRWSKSFDNWYAMDDERINESLACDCCNRWFHIGCLPPIKSSGRFKDTTYVCPTCLDDARGFYSGTRTTATSSKSSKSTANANGASATTTSSSSRRKKEGASSTPNEDSVSSSKKRSTKLVVPSDSEDGDEDEEDAPVPAKSKSSKKTSEKENVKDENASKSKKRRRANSIDSTASTGSDKRAKAAAASPVKKSESEPTSSKRNTKSTRRRERSSSREEEEETKASESTDKAVEPQGDDEAKAEATGAASKEDVPMGEPETTAASKSPRNETAEGASSKPSDDPSAPSQDADRDSLTMEKPTIKRKISGHSMSSLLNSPSSPPRDSPEPAAANASVRVKVEKDQLALPPTQAPAATSGAAKKAAPTRSKVWVTGRDAKTAKAAAAAAASATPAATGNRNALSAFDILREVAAQSMSDEIDAPGASMASATALPPASAPSRRTQKPRMTAAERKAHVKSEADKAAALAAASSSSSATSTTNGRPMPTSSSSSAPIGVGIPMNSYVDLHFAIRKEMYLRICLLEDERLLERETAQLLRSMIYPTSDKFHDLKFVYVVNKDLSSLQLTKRLLELVPITSGGTAPVIPMRPALGMNQLPHPHPPHALLTAGSANSSAAPSPARPSHAPANTNTSTTGYTTPARTASPAFDHSHSHATTPQQPEPEPSHHHHHHPSHPHPPGPHKLFQLPTSMGFARASSSSASSSSSILTSVISPSSVVGPPMPPPPLSTKLLLETMHKHSKFPTLRPPPPAPAPASVPVVAPSATASAVPTATPSSAPAPAASSTTPAPASSSVPSVLPTPSPATTSSSSVAAVSVAASSASSSTVVASSTTTPAVVAPVPSVAPPSTATAPAAPAPLPAKPSPEGPSPPAPPHAAPLVNNISASISSN